MNQIIEANSFSLGQLKTFLMQLNNEEYTLPLKVFSQSSLGMHNRHIIEFYQCLLLSGNTSCVNYDKRERNLLLENNVSYAVECIEEVTGKLQSINLNQTIELQMDISCNGNEKTVESNVDREMVYLLEHTIHHMAILKMGCIVSFPHIKLEADFGVAYSTIKHKKDVYRNLSTY